MVQRVFIKVVGFTDVERHALNTVFRLSEQRQIVYALWMPGAPDEPMLALVDGLSYEAPMEVKAFPEKLKLVWVGPEASPNAWRTFERPLSWPDVIAAIDELFTPESATDFDLGISQPFADTVPPEPTEPVKRALIASPQLDDRLYLRAK